MGEATLKVPAEYVETFRSNVYSRLAAEGDALEKPATVLAFPDGSLAHPEPLDEDETERYAVDVLKATRNIAALVEVMDQLGWTDPIEGDAELTADPELLRYLVESCLVDAGSAVHEFTEHLPFDRAGFEAATARATWLADRRDQFEAVAV